MCFSILVRITTTTIVPRRLRRGAIENNGGVLDSKEERGRGYTCLLLEFRPNLRFDPILCRASLPVVLKSNVQTIAMAHSVPFYLPVGRSPILCRRPSMKVKGLSKPGRLNGSSVVQAYPHAGRWMRVGSMSLDKSQPFKKLLYAS